MPDDRPPIPPAVRKSNGDAMALYNQVRRNQRPRPDMAQPKPTRRRTHDRRGFRVNVPLTPREEIGEELLWDF